ncbi:MAG: cytochrome c biogenesis protein CcsA [Sulfurihydrogenibium sp.]|nr:MAG: cytochrome C biogenesis protein [Sulfurihydrogenibium sp.]
MSKILLILPILLYFASSISFWIYLFTRNSKIQKLGHSFFGVGFLAQLFIFTLKAIDKKTIPLYSLEDLVTFLAMVLATIFYGFSFVYRRQLIEFGSLVSPLIMFLLAFSIPLSQNNQNLYNNPWFYLHVGSLILSYGLIVFSSIAALIYILTDRDLKRKRINSFFVVKFSSSLSLIQNLEYKATILAFIFLSLGLIASSIWTAVYVGKHWIWDAKQVLLFVLWIFYGFVIHARIIKHVKGRKGSYLTLVGSLFAFIVFWLVGHPTF